MSAVLTIREINTEELPTAFAIVRQLRDHLDLTEFKSRAAKQAENGYRLYGAFDAGRSLLGVLGMRRVTTLARGDHLHIDDLIVDKENRSVGIGTALLQYAERWAANNSLQAVFLDSRPEVVSFYAALGYQPHTATLMRKRIDVVDPLNHLRSLDMSNNKNETGPISFDLAPEQAQALQTLAGSSRVRLSGVVQNGRLVVNFIACNAPFVACNAPFTACNAPFKS